MGGTITSVIRLKDSTTIPMRRWTNSVSAFYQSPKLFTDTDHHIECYLKSWYEMKEDYEKNHESGQFEFPMTDAYFPSMGFIPEAYGFVALDLMKNQIISCNSYTNIRIIDIVSLLMSVNGNRLGETEDDNEFDDFVELCRQGRITKYLKWNGKNKEFDTKDIKFYDVDENTIALGSHGIIPLDRKFFKEHTSTLMETTIQFILDYSPMTVHNYEYDCLDDLTKAFEHVKKDFELSSEEIIQWETEIIERSAEH